MMNGIRKDEQINDTVDEGFKYFIQYTKWNCYRIENTNIYIKAIVSFIRIHSRNMNTKEVLIWKI